LETTSIPGVKNSGLFASHELKVGVPKREDWSQACGVSAPLLTLRDHELIERLGYETASAGAHALVLTGSGPRPEAIAVMLEDGETFDADSQRFSVSPVAYGLKMAEQAAVSWLILSRGGQLRLYPARIDLGVGRKGLAETFLELDLPQLTKDTAGYLSLILSAAALKDGGSAFEIMHASAIYAVALSERLRDKVYEEIVPRLSLAAAKQLSQHGYQMDASGLDLAYQLTLRIFFRMLFQTYAEDRKLLPFGENAKYDRNALKTVALDLVETPDQPFDPDSTSLWDDLAQVWHVIDKGDKAWGVPAYNGGLFGADPELNSHGAIIESLAITNDVIGPCLKALLLDESKDGEFGPIDFRSLSVREFGTIYEGLLESSLGLADVDLTLDADGTWLPAKKKDKVEAAAGEVYFHNTSGQRKGTGSYYTPTFVVEHLLERSVDPALDDHLANVAQLIETGDQAGAAERFFDFRVADLAMGSGHFLTAAIDHIEQKMAAFLEEDGHQIPGVTKEIVLLGNAARQAVGDPEGPAPEGSSLLRRQIARRCIYGLDINPISVELARVAIWIHTFVRGLPMSSLDHNLVCANSLTGIGSLEEAFDVLVPGRKGDQFTLFDAPIEEALNRARDVLVDVAAAAESTRTEAQAAARAAQRARTEAETAKLLFDAAVLTRTGHGDLVAHVEPHKIAQLAAEPSAQAVIAVIAPAHMPYLFPEVFLSGRGGFDVLIGNPPWEKLKVEEHQWWWLRFPGLRGLPVAQRTRRIAMLQEERSDLRAEFESDIEASKALRDILIAGPFPGIGAGHVDLYKAFAWRNWQLLRKEGRFGVVLPRAALTGAGTEQWRRVILREGVFTDVCTATNNRHWVFGGVHASQPIAFVVGARGTHLRTVSTVGPFNSREEFDVGRQSLAVVDVDEFLTWSTSASFPFLPDARSAEIFRQMRRNPEFRTGEFRPVIELRPVEDRSRIDTDLTKPSGPIKVLTGGSFNIWDPDFGEPYGYAKDSLIRHLFSKTQRSSKMARSPFHGMVFASTSDLPCFRARVAFRDVTKYDNTRTAIAALLPPGVAVMHSCPYLLRAEADERDEAYVLGVMSSIPFDWYARRIVELHLTFDLLGSMPVPRPDRSDHRWTRVVEVSGRLAASDDRFTDWASSVGVPTGSVHELGHKVELEAELDALVGTLYGLSRDQLQHIFATFHRGWDYQPRLERVSGYFDQIQSAS
jgi:hypothetical protein